MKSNLSWSRAAGPRTRAAGAARAAAAAAVALLACVPLGRAAWRPAAAAEPGLHETLNGRHIVGYQGWFGCPGDGGAGGDGWRHWFARRPDGLLAPAVDQLPDASEMGPDEGCATGWTDGHGRPVRVFTAQDARTVDRHFAWMARHGLHGAALQRFLVEVASPARRPAEDRVLRNVLRAAGAHGRSAFVMYDLSGAGEDRLRLVVEDWSRLVAEGAAADPAYQRHRGRPVLGVWGIGFRGRPLTPAGAAAMLDELRRVSGAGGVSLLGGVPSGWRTGEGDADAEPGWRAVFARFDVLSPWTVGRFADDAGADAHLRRRLLPDLRDAALSGQDYMPVLFPGFSWSNLMRARGRDGPFNQIPRRCGAFYWRQAGNAVNAGASMLYTAMFDEVDEATAIFKLAPTRRDLPPDAPAFVPLDADGCDLPADWYLRLAGAAARGLAAGGLPAGMPAPPPAPR